MENTNIDMLVIRRSYSKNNLTRTIVPHLYSNKR